MLVITMAQINFGSAAQHTAWGMSEFEFNIGCFSPDASVYSGRSRISSRALGEPIFLMLWTCFHVVWGIRKLLTDWFFMVLISHAPGVA
jgi:hypothetical protein